MKKKFDMKIWMKAKFVEQGGCCAVCDKELREPPTVNRVFNDPGTKDPVSLVCGNCWWILFHCDYDYRKLAKVFLFLQEYRGGR